MAEIQQILQQSYDRQKWGELLHRVFPNVAIWQTPKQVTDGVPDFVQEYAQLGSVRLVDGKNLSVFEIQINENIDLLRNRIRLRNLVARHIDQGTAHGVLCIFSSASQEYRFTFVSKESGFDEEGRISTVETNPRRYTYVLGPGETRKTAAQRFNELMQHRDVASLKHVADAFSVERLNEEFFSKYKEHYQRFVQHLIDSSIPKQVFGVSTSRNSNHYEEDCKPVRDFVKKLLGRIVFIQFLQKKGWMGCSIGSNKWIDGDHDFLLNQFNSFEKKEKFHSGFLAPLFFDALNTPGRSEDIFPVCNSRVPYLNGGLFEEVIQTARGIDFPAVLFKDLLELFSEYNFTIDENDPIEHEVGIDPEMLGHIFENLIEENKDKGVYYTPKPVVQFMCQESILLFLQSHFGEQDSLQNLVRQKDAGPDEKDNWIRINAARIEKLLDNVTVCDPAIGSGAFPIGILQEIFWIKLSLDWTLNDPTLFASLPFS